MRRHLGTVLLFGAFACGAVRADDQSAEAVARAWMLSIRTDDLSLVSTRTAMPFIYREAWPRKHCQQTVRNERGLRKWFECVRRHEDLLVKELEWERDNLRVTQGLENSTPALRKLASEVHSAGTWVSAGVNGDGVTYGLQILVIDKNGTNRVRAVLIESSFDSG